MDNRTVGGRSTHFRWTATRQNDSLVLIFTGELDLAGREAFDSNFDDLLAADVRRVLLDLRGLEFMDSTGLSLLLRLRRECVVRGTSLVLGGVGSAVSRVLEIAGFATTFDYVEGEAIPR